MKHAIIPLFLLCMTACAKPDEPQICHATIFKAPIEVAFIGYTKDELDTIITKRYSEGTNFMQLMDTSLVTDTNVVLMQDTLLRSDGLFNTGYQGFADLRDGYDYEIVVPSIDKRYRISDISFPVDSAYTYVANQHGCTDGANPRFKYCDALTLDSQSVIPSSHFTYPFRSPPFTSVSLLYLNRQ